MKKMKLEKKSIKNFLKAVIVATITLTFILQGSAMFVNIESGNMLEGIGTLATTQVSIYPLVQTVKKGETFTVDVYVEPSEPTIGVAFDNLYFDQTLIQANSVTEGDLFNPHPTFFNAGTIDNVAGTITDVYGVTVPVQTVNESGTFCTIEFTAQQQLGTSLLDIEGVSVSNATGEPVPITVNDGKVAIVWSVTLDFNEPGGKSDYLVFGEADDANDGPLTDSYDEPKPPAPMPPYLRAWLDDSLSPPYDSLWEDYREYPDVYKVWNLYVQWESSSSSPTSIITSWDIDEFDDCEYNSIVLRRYDPFDAEWDFAVDMLIENDYTYTPRYFASSWLTDHFQITAVLDILPPEITDVTLMTSYTLDIVPGFGWENFSCTVTDNVEVDEVQLNLTYPDLHTESIPMNKNGDNYYYNTTLTDAGYYNYYIWTNDTSRNENTSTTQPFELPPNWDVNKDGRVHLQDFVLVAMRYGDTGPNGWIREDVNNDGWVHLQDFVMIAGHYGEYWK